MADLTPIIIPAASAASAALFATAGTLFVGRERTTQRIERLSQAMERCKDDERLRAEFSRTIEAELLRYKKERHGEWLVRLMITLFGGALYFLGLVIVTISSGTPVYWPFWGWTILALGALILFTFPLGIDKRIEEKVTSMKERRNK